MAAHAFVGLFAKRIPRAELLFITRAHTQTKPLIIVAHWRVFLSIIQSPRGNKRGLAVQDQGAVWLFGQLWWKLNHTMTPLPWKEAASERLSSLKDSVLVELFLFPLTHLAAASDDAVLDISSNKDRRSTAVKNVKWEDSLM